MGNIMDWNVYLSGEIHTDWRQQIQDGCKSHTLPVHFTSAVTDHEASDAAGDLLGAEDSNFWRDHKSAKVNAIRTRTLIENCDVAVVRFGAQYKQWNAAFDAGYCAALGKPYITLHDEDIIHPLKEVDASALAWATTPEQVVKILKYVIAKG
jgi:YtoQ family protein